MSNVDELLYIDPIFLPILTFRPHGLRAANLFSIVFLSFFFVFPEIGWVTD
jgi:hypothetical protein